MTKYEYLAELERLLSALPEQDRRDAMNYYEEYFVSAGPEKEAESIHELGTPQEVARKILEEAGIRPGRTPSGGAPMYTTAPPVTHRKLSTPMIVLLVIVGVLIVLLIALGLLGGIVGNLARDSYRTATTATVESEPADGALGGSSAASQQSATSSTAETANGTVSLGAGLRELDIHLYDIDLTVAVDPNITEPVVSAPDLPQDQLIVRTGSDGDIKLYLGDQSRLQNLHDHDPVPVTLTLPADVSSQDMDIELSAGKVKMPDLALRELDVKVNAGSVTLGAVEAQTIDIEINAGSVTATALSANEVDFGTNAGSIEVETITTGSIDMETNAGSLTVDRLEYSGEGEFDVNAGSMQVGLAGQENDYSLIADITGGHLTYGDTTYANSEIRGQGTGSRTLKIDVKLGDATFSFVG